MPGQGRVSQKVVLTHDVSVLGAIAREHVYLRKPDKLADACTVAVDGVVEQNPVHREVCLLGGIGRSAKETKRAVVVHTHEFLAERTVKDAFEESGQACETENKRQPAGRAPPAVIKFVKVVVAEKTAIGPDVAAAMSVEVDCVDSGVDIISQGLGGAEFVFIERRSRIGVHTKRIHSRTDHLRSNGIVERGKIVFPSSEQQQVVAPWARFGRGKAFHGFVDEDSHFRGILGGKPADAERREHVVVRSGEIAVV